MTSLPQRLLQLGCCFVVFPHSCKGCFQLGDPIACHPGANLEPCPGGVGYPAASTADVELRLKLVATSRQEDASPATPSATLGEKDRRCAAMHAHVASRASSE